MFHAVTFNTLGGSLSGFFEWVFHYAWLYNIMHLSLEDLGYWIICKFSIYCHITIHIVKTSYLLISLLISLKSQRVLESQILFCKTLIFTWTLEFYHWQQILAVVFLDRTKSSSFSRKRLANTQVQIIIVCLSVILSVKVEKTASLAYTSVFQLFSPETPVIFQLILEILYVYFPFCHAE